MRFYLYFFGSQISWTGLTDMKHLKWSTWQSRAPHAPVAVAVRSLGHLACLQNSACGKFLIRISSAIIGLRCALLVHAVLTGRCIRERERESKQASKKARKQESKQDSKTARKQESKKARKQESKKARKKERKKERRRSDRSLERMSQFAAT